MGREIRRVPANWQHPMRDPEANPYRHTGYQPMYNETFESRFAKWLADFDRIRRGEMTDWEREVYPLGLGQWLKDESPPDPDYFRPWADAEAVWFQCWETVSEGTPVSPPFATRDELIDYLATRGDFWDQKRGDAPWGRKAAERFVNAGWAPSGIFTPETGFVDGKLAI